MSEIKKALRDLTKTDDELYSVICKVTKVDKRRKVVNVEPLNGDAEILGVRLQANESDTEGVFVFPVVGSNVIVTFTNASTGYVAMVSRVQSAEIAISKLKIVLDTEGVHIERDGASLLAMMHEIIANTESLYSLIAKIKVTTPTGIGLLQPDLVAEAKTRKAQLAQLKNDVKKIFT